MSSRPTIFVSIASYRDPDCGNTVRDLFDKACHPDRVIVGLCLQIAGQGDEDCRVDCGRPSQLRLIEIDASDSLGACWARSQVQGLWQGEDFYFQIDSHMRFVAGWDERLITLLGACSGDKPVLSTYPLEFTPPDQFAPERLVTIRPKGFDLDGVLVQNSILTPIESAPPRPALTPFISAGMLFAAGRVVEEVPYDPLLYFTGEEISLGARLWTHGWDIHCPNRVIAWHNYGKQPERPRHWADRQDWVALSRRSRQRLRQLFGIETSPDAQSVARIAEFGLGSVRSLAEYESFSGLDFRCRLWRSKPLPLPEQSADLPEQVETRRTVFQGIWRDNFWRSAESRSGPGAEMTATHELRQALPPLMDSLGVRILGDAGCGDLNWMQTLTPSLRLYLGFDIVGALVADLRQRFKARHNCFFSELDIVTDALPECDLILCRDCLTHLTPDAALLALQAFRRSGSRYLLATTHETGKEGGNVWIRTGGWYAMDLTAAPFNLPPPQRVIHEGRSKRLALWNIEDLPL